MRVRFDRALDVPGASSVHPLARLHALAAISPGVSEHLARAHRAAAFVRSGRHTAAERLLRDVAGALTRRRAPVQAASVLVSLGRLMLERGRAAEAAQVFTQATDVAAASGHRALSRDAMLWGIAASTDAGHLVSAAAQAADLLGATELSATHRAWARACAGRIALWHARAVAHDQLPSVIDEEADPVVCIWVEATAVRMLLANGRWFEAGQRAGEATARWSASPDPTVRAIVESVRLRVACAGGDLPAARHSLGALAAHAREGRAPLRWLRGRLLWIEALRRGHRVAEARREATVLGRIARRVPPLLRGAIEQAQAAWREPAQAPGCASTTDPDIGTAVGLVRDALTADDDAASVCCVLEHVLHALRAERIDLTSGTGRLIATVGQGAPVAACGGVGSRARAGPVTHRSGCLVSLPLWHDGRIGAVLRARWPLAAPPSQPLAWLDVAAAAIVPRLEILAPLSGSQTRTSRVLPELLGVSEPVERLRTAVSRAAAAPFSVFIEGESGVGKELLARAIHRLSPRAAGRFCDVNCAALPDELVESELFGHARGAFTGALANRAGLFEEASGGTLFLDEVAELSSRAQAKLLRVLQQHEVRRLGESSTRPVDVRVVCAANRTMAAEAALGRFRSDLLYRLDVIHLHVPPLRDRREDIPVLVEALWPAAARRVGSRASLTRGVLTALAGYDWPGNVRELQNVMAALAVAAPAQGRVSASSLPPHVRVVRRDPPSRLADARTSFERAFVSTALARAGGCRADAARALGVTRQGLLKLMARLDLRGMEDGRQT